MTDEYVRFLDRTSTRPGERHPALELLELGPGQRCLDLGCGVGEDARAKDLRARDDRGLYACHALLFVAAGRVSGPGGAAAWKPR
jgi:hypothetical protein